MSKVVTIPTGTRGFDCNTPVTPEYARRFMDHGYRFVCRYVPRITARAYDISATEVHDLLTAGLAIMPVQHVERETAIGWTPTKVKGDNYGTVAAEHAIRVGIDMGCCVWLDLEGVNLRTPKQDVIDYCNAWWSAVGSAGFTPGIYIGYNPGLTGNELYYKLKFEHYWSGYNLNKDQFPAIRGVQMLQSAAKQSDMPPGVKWAKEDIDTDIVHADQKGGLPLAFVPDEWDVPR